MYKPKPIDTSNINLSPEIIELSEILAKNVHENWAKSRIEQGWTYGEKRNDDKKESPCIVEYEKLSEEEKDYDRNTSLETLKTIQKLGYEIKRK
jgi:hypothetical protein